MSLMRQLAADAQMVTGPVERIIAMRPGQNYDGPVMVPAPQGKG